jgi:hypothetical protein
VGSQRPNIAGNPDLVRNVNCWFYDSRNPTCRNLRSSGTDAFAVPAQYTYGNGGINILRADGLVQFDVSLIKSLRFSESRSIEFRASFYNIFNHTTFAAPSTNIDATSAGTISSTLNAAHQAELAAKIYF